MKETEQIGLFGGSFDPIHLGHLNIASQLKSLANLSKVLFIPAAVSPFKMDEPPKASDDDRLRMCEIAIEGIEGYELCDLELERGVASYMIDTVKTLLKNPLYENVQFRLIISEDALSQLHKWKEAETLVRLAPPLIGSRHKAKGLNLSKYFSPEAVSIIEAGMMETKVSPISSTEVRKALQEGNFDLADWIPEKVLDYIKHNKLYSRRYYEERSPRNTKSGCADRL